MAIKKKLLLWASLISSLSVQAQGIERIDTLDDINAIKRDTSFIYAESTMKDVLEAHTGAQALLQLKIIEWLRFNHPELDSESLVTNSKEKWFSLLTKRGAYNRLFVYVNKRDIVPIKEEPEPVFEEEQILPLTPEEETMAVSIVRFENIEPYVKNLKADGQLKAYGKYASLPQDESCYMFVYNREGNIEAVLRQTEDGKHFNLRTMKEDNVHNYKNCGAIWLQFK
jgi:hypothetical protein